MKITLVKSFKLTGEYVGRCRYCGHGSPVWSCRVYIEGITERKQMFGREVDKELNQYANWVLCARHRAKLINDQVKKEHLPGIEQSAGSPPRRDKHWPYMQQIVHSSVAEAKQKQVQAIQKQEGGDVE